jgi:hypothetical protein
VLRGSGEAVFFGFFWAGCILVSFEGNSIVCEIWVAGWRRLSDGWASSNFQFGFPFKRHLFQIVSSSQMLIACIDGLELNFAHQWFLRK